MEGKNPFFFFTFCDFNETFIFMTNFSMEAGPKMNYKLVVQRKEGHILSYHVPKWPEVKKKINFWYSKVNVSKQTETAKLQLFCWLFFRQTGLWEPNPPQKEQVFIFLHTPIPVNNAEILAFELVGDQNEMLVRIFFIFFSCYCGDNRKALLQKI